LVQERKGSRERGWVAPPAGELKGSPSLERASREGKWLYIVGGKTWGDRKGAKEGRLIFGNGLDRS